MKNISLFFIGIILLVFAAFFHVYRYAMAQQKSAPPPAPVLVVDERPKLAESSESDESDKIAEISAKYEDKSEPKEIA